MVQKEETRRLGRPREYDPNIAIDRAMEAFWDAGFSGTSLDDLSARMGMNRPSLYAAFGDKETLYLKTLESYCAARRTAIDSVLGSGCPLRDSLRALYAVMVDRFLDGERGARGCYLVGTAVSEAVENPKVREVLAESTRELDEGFRAAFSAAKARGELGKDADPRTLAILASAVVHTVALRARAGQPRAVLQEVVDSAVKLMFSSGGAARKQRRSIEKRTRRS
jgi:TetR/AcrR family transcriptional regulator, copper-responsive repressor